MESIEKQDGLLLPCLIELAEITPKFLRHQLPVVMELCIKVKIKIFFTLNIYKYFEFVI